MLRVADCVHQRLKRNKETAMKQLAYNWDHHTYWLRLQKTKYLQSISEHNVTSKKQEPPRCSFQTLTVFLFLIYRKNVSWFSIWRLCALSHTSHVLLSCSQLCSHYDQNNPLTMSQSKWEEMRAMSAHLHHVDAVISGALGMLLFVSSGGMSQTGLWTVVGGE